MTVTNILHKGDLPDGLDLGPLVAIDCETMGLNFNRDRLCLVQLSSGNGVAHMVQIEVEQNSAPNLCKLLSNEETLKIFLNNSITPFRNPLEKKHLKDLLFRSMRRNV